MVDVNTEIKLPLRLTRTSTSVVAVGPIIVTNTSCPRTRTIPPISGTSLPTFTGGTVTITLATGAVATSPSGNSGSITVATPGVYRVGVYIKADGKLYVAVGAVGGAMPTNITDARMIGYISTTVSGGAVQALTDADIIQYSSSSFSASEMIAASVTDAGVVTTGTQSFAGIKTFTSASTFFGIDGVNDTSITIQSTNNTSASVKLRADWSVADGFDLKYDGTSDSFGIVSSLHTTGAQTVMSFPLGSPTFGTQIQTYTGMVVNESGIDSDFRVESDANENMLFVDAGNNRVGIGTNAPATNLHVSGDFGGTWAVGLQLTGTTSHGAFLSLKSDHATWGIGMDSTNTRLSIVNGRYTGAVGTEVVSIAAAGDSSFGSVGIGNDSPFFGLSVKTRPYSYTYTYASFGTNYPLFLVADNTPALGFNIYHYGDGYMGWSDWRLGGATATYGGAIRFDLVAGRFDFSTSVSGSLGDDAVLTERFGISRTETVVNDLGADYSFRVEGDTDANLICTGTGSYKDRVGIGTSTPAGKLGFAAATGNADGIVFGTDTNLYRSAADTLKTDDTLVVAGFQIGSSVPFSDSAGTLTLQNVDDLDATTQTTIQNHIVTSGTFNAVAGTSGGWVANNNITLTYYRIGNVMLIHIPAFTATQDTSGLFKIYCSWPGSKAPLHEAASYCTIRHGDVDEAGLCYTKASDSWIYFRPYLGGSVSTAASTQKGLGIQGLWFTVAVSA